MKGFLTLLVLGALLLPAQQVNACPTKCPCSKVLICHIPPGNPANAHNICISKNAVRAHLEHGDYFGKCHVDSIDAGIKSDTGITPDAGVEQDTGITPDTKPGIKVVVFDPKFGIPDAGTKADTETTCLDEPEDDLEMIGGGCAMSGGDPTFTSLGLFGSLVILILFGIVRKNVIFIIIGISLISINVYADDYIVSKSSETAGHLKPSIGLTFDYKHRPAQIVKKSNGKRVADVVHHTTGLTLSGSLGLWSWLQVDLALPFELSQEANGSYLGKSNESLNGGLGDISLTPRASLLSTKRHDERLSLGFALPIGFPTCTYDSIIGANAWYMTPTIMLESQDKFVSIVLNAGYTIVADQSMVFRSQKVIFDDAFTFSLGVRVPIWKDKMDLLGDGYVTVPTSQTDKEDVPAELLGGLRFYFPYGIQADIAAGSGVGKGVGAPEFRILAGLSWSPKPQPVKVVYTALFIHKVDCPECPECLEPTVENKVLVIPHVYFDTDKHFLRPDAIETLGKTVKLLKENPWVKKIRLEGHCDHRASNKYNEALSLRRVTVVRDYLVKNGIKLKRLEARNYGETQRVDVTKTEKGMQKNRRVEFHIMEIE